MRTKEVDVFENDKLIITRDRFNWIVREKPLPREKDAYLYATYINDENNLLWEVCTCRKVCGVGSGMAKDIENARRRTESL